MMLQIEPLEGHFMFAIGNFSDTVDASGSTRVTGLVTESEPGVFQFAFIIMNWGIGLAFKL